MFRGVLMSVLGLVVWTMPHANTTADDFPALKAYAKSLRSTPLNAMNQFNPNVQFKDYNEHPAETSFYKGVDVDEANLTNAANEALKQDAGGKVVVENFGKNQFEINKENAFIQEAMRIEAESYAITHGISNDRVHCDAKPKMQCTPTFHEESCSTSRILPEEQCLKKRVVKVASENIHQAIQAVVTIHKNFKGSIAINLVTGAMSNVVGGSLSSRLQLHHECQSMSITIHSIFNNNKPAKWVDVIGLPSCQNNGWLTLHITHSFKREYPLQISLTGHAATGAFVAEEHWESNCGALDAKVQEGLCSVKEERCTDTTNPRVIDGLPVTRDCWESSATYACHSVIADECLAQKERGCLQMSSRCDRNSDNGCIQYAQVYQCPDKTCPPVIECMQDVFCADGECVDKVSTQNTNFGKDIAPLAATNAVGREFSATQASLFGGHVAQCKIWALDVIDCCSDKGWGKAIDLVHCRDEDKKLGEAKLNYLAHYLGEFCATEVLGVCLEHKRTYCVFDSKMARIIQEEGRLKQLNPEALGNAKHPTCAGLSMNELQRLDLGIVEFVKPVYPAPPAGDGVPTMEAGIVGDIQPNFPNPDKTLDEITKRIQKKAGG